MPDPAVHLQEFRHEGIGYLPLVLSDGWQAAILNWEPPIDRTNLGEIERHLRTDEVFVLWRGKAALFVSVEDKIHLVDLQPGVIYNVVRGSWHNLVASRDVSILIVENRGTDLNDTEIRRLTAGEQDQIQDRLPDWVRREQG